MCKRFCEIINSNELTLAKSLKDDIKYSYKIKVKYREGDVSRLHLMLILKYCYWL